MNRQKLIFELEPGNEKVIVPFPKSKVYLDYETVKDLFKMAMT
jgi:hypothetical protein